MRGDDRRTTLPAPSRRGRWLAVLLAVPLCSGAECLALLDDEPVGCGANCAIEAECGLRTEAECLAASCDPQTGQPLSADADDCLADADDCLEAAACACGAGCDRLDACADSEADPSCAASCDTLIDQQPIQTYQENRCRIEAVECSELASCSRVSG